MISHVAEKDSILDNPGEGLFFTTSNNDHNHVLQKLSLYHLRHAHHLETASHPFQPRTLSPLLPSFLFPLCTRVLLCHVSSFNFKIDDMTEKKKKKTIIGKVIKKLRYADPTHSKKEKKIKIF